MNISWPLSPILVVGSLLCSWESRFLLTRLSSEKQTRAVISEIFTPQSATLLTALTGCVSTNADTFIYCILCQTIHYWQSTEIHNTLALRLGFLESMTMFMSVLFFDNFDWLYHWRCFYICFASYLCLTPSQKASAWLPLSDSHQSLAGIAGLESGVSGQFLAVLLGFIWTLCGCSIHTALLPPSIIHLDGIGGHSYVFCTCESI